MSIRPWVFILAAVLGLAGLSWWVWSRQGPTVKAAVEKAGTWTPTWTPAVYTPQEPKTTKEEDARDKLLKELLVTQQAQQRQLEANQQAHQREMEAVRKALEAKQQQAQQTKPAAPAPPKPVRWTLAAIPERKDTESLTTEQRMKKATDEAAQLIHQAIHEIPARPERTLYRSQFLPVQTMHEVNSDIQGQVRFLVTRDVVDRFAQGQVLIPQHSIVIARQQEAPKFGQNRLELAVEEVHFPQGDIVKLVGQGADKGGAAGMTGKVDHHLDKIILGAFISAALNIGVRAPWGSTQGYNASLPQQYSQEVADGLSRPAQRIVDRMINIPPTIRIPQGAQGTIEVYENISLAQAPRIVK